jgi:hypothetical protein
MTKTDAAPNRFKVDLTRSPPASERPLFAHSGRLESTDSLEKLEFPHRSQLAASMKNSLGG